MAGPAALARPAAGAVRAAVPLGVAGLLLTMRAVDPVAASLAAGGWWPACVFHRLTGLLCVGCGMSRAAHALAAGDLAGAARMNLLLVPMLLIALAVAAWPRLWSGRARRTQAGLAWAAAAGLTLFWVLRNLPARELAWLRPDGAGIFP